MLGNYVITTLRNLRRNKSYALINVTGLSLGLACALLIFLIVKNELGYDRFHDNYDRIYRITNFSHIDQNANISYAVVPGLRNDFPQLEKVTQLRYNANALITVRNEKFDEKAVAFAEPDLLDIFSFAWIAGKKQGALTEPNTVVLTEKLAFKYFGVRPGDAAGYQGRVLNQVINIDNRVDLRVVGVMKDVPVNTHLPLNMLIAASTLKLDPNEVMKQWWGINGDSYGYLLLPEKYDIAQLEKQVPAFIRKHRNDEAVKNFTIKFQPLHDVHFNLAVVNNITAPIRKGNLYVLAAVALIIIVLACINFVNLATAQAVKRGHEVGVRKVLGANRGQLVTQFLGEASVLTLAALVTAGALVALFRQPLLQALGIELATGLGDPAIPAFFLAAFVGVSLLSGLYPAWVVANFQPVAALKNKLTALPARRLNLRKGLVAFQFTTSQVLIICTLVVAAQMDFFQNQDLGFGKDAVVSFSIPDTSSSKRAVLRSELLKYPGVAGVSFASGSPVTTRSWADLSLPGSPEKQKPITEIKFVDEHFFGLFKLQVVAGRGIASEDRTTPYGKAVINQTAVQALGFKDPFKAIGKNIQVGGDNNVLQVVGVVKDFHNVSKHQKIPACVIVYGEGEDHRQGSLQLAGGNWRQTLDHLDKTWSATYPESLFTYQFVDEQVARQYEREGKVYRVVQFFTGMAIAIGMLGLFGLVSFITLQRTKEVGVRKVMGASVPQIMVLFSKEFVILVGFSFLLACPLSFYLMDGWLAGFPYRVGLAPWMFGAAGLLALLITVVTVSLQSFKAALADPVRSLRAD
jgi:ABC-type antimicrobial peptide transport system permease subunit